MNGYRLLLSALAFLFLAGTTTASDTILRRADVPPAVTGPIFMLTLTDLNSYIAVAATDGSGVNGSTRGDLLLRTTQRLLISTNDGGSAAVTVDPVGNVSVAGSMSATSFIGSVSTATNFSGSLAGDVKGSQAATQVATVGGQTAADVATGVQAANDATSANAANTIAKRDANGTIAVGGIQFADGSVLSSASLKKYYISTTGVVGSQATTQCAQGFHMASMWELINPAVLSYDTTRGLQSEDSGSGPPVYPAWVRTGEPAGAIDVAGAANCNAWTSNSSNDYGTTVRLPYLWSDEAQPLTVHHVIEPWVAVTAQCSEQRTTWCIQD